MNNDLDTARAAMKEPAPATPAEPTRRCGPFEQREGSRKCLKCHDIIFDFEDTDD